MVALETKYCADRRRILDYVAEASRSVEDACKIFRNYGV